MDLNTKMMKIMETGEMVLRPFIVILQASKNNKSFTFECSQTIQELNCGDRAKIEVCEQYS